ncbi:MAG TPA: ROK family protein [Trueperaceae bacterium]|nr:ROK family protein [Trueperaceae bacterium]
MSRRRARRTTPFRTASTGFSRDVNRAAILRLIGGAGPIARKDIVAELGLSSATVTGITRELLAQGLIRVAERAPSRGGRPALLLELVGEAATALGVKIAVDHLVGVRVDLEASELERYEAPFDAAAEGSVERLAEILDGWLGGSDGHPPLLGIGIGVPGVFDAATGELDSPLLGWRGVRLAERLEAGVRAPVFVDNDVNTLAVWERLYGRGRGHEHFIAVTIGRGVGLGIVAGGDIYRGFRGGAGEFGHVSMTADGPEEGPLCTCGKRGCLEALVGDPALVAQARAAGLLAAGDGPAELLARAEAGDERTRAIYARAGATLGRAVSGLVNVLAPELVLLSGEGTQAWPWLEPTFERELRAHLFPAAASVGIEVDPWDDGKWAVGAASLVLRATLTGPLEGADSDLAGARLVAPDPGPTGVVD